MSKLLSLGIATRKDRFKSRKKRSCGWVSLLFAVLLLTGVPLRAAVYYVASTGNDGNAGSSGSPWASLNYAVNHVACGDTINVVANGSTVAGDANVPYFAGCSSTTTVQSSALASLQPVGYRVRPDTDTANLGRLQMTNQGIDLTVEAHGAGYCVISEVINDTFVSSYCSANWANVANGTQVILQIDSQGNNLASDVPSNLTILTKYYIVSCLLCGSATSNPATSTTSLAIGTGSKTFTTQSGLSGYVAGNRVRASSAANTTNFIEGLVTSYSGSTLVISIDTIGGSGTHTDWNLAVSGTFQLSATSGGAAITGNTCTGTCIPSALNIGEPLQVDTVGNTLTSPDAFTVMGNNIPFYVASSGLQLNTLTSPASSIPGGLALDTQYLMCNVIGRAFKVGLGSCSSIVTLTSIGVGPLQMSDARAPNHWKFDGLELIQAPGHLIYGMFYFGFGNEASILGMVNNVEVSRTWMHEDATQESDFIGYHNGIVDNAAYGNYHDNYISGATNSEAHAIVGWGSPGPTLITNNFLEATGENTLYGGQQNSAGISNANKIFSGNFYYKPPAWRTNSFNGVPSGPCWYDNYDAHHTGGQWFTNLNNGQVYRCNSSGMWATTASSPPVINTLIKLLAEHKNGRVFTYTGNVFEYSWPQAQSGQVFNMGQQQGSGPGMANDTITVQNNKSTHTSMFLNFGESCFLTTALPCLTPLLPKNITILNNSVTIEQAACGVPSAGGTADCGAHLYTFQPTGYPPTNITWNKNTVVTVPDGLAATYPWDASASFFSPTSPLMFDQWTYTNSLVGYDFQIDPGNPCGVAISGAFTNSTFDRIANPNAGCMAYTSVGATNTFTHWSPQTGNAGVGFVNLSGGDLHLATTSPYSASCASGCAFTSSDGTDIGADIDAINAAASGAVVGTPNWYALYLTSIIPTPSTLQFNLTGSTNYTVTIYNAPARIAANQVAQQTCTISAGSCSTIFTGLTPNTQYYAKASDGSTLMTFPRIGVTEVFTSITGNSRHSITGTRTITGKRTF